MKDSGITDQDLNLQPQDRAIPSRTFFQKWWVFLFFFVLDVVLIATLFAPTRRIHSGSTLRDALANGQVQYVFAIESKVFYILSRRSSRTDYQLVTVNLSSVTQRPTVTRLDSSVDLHHRRTRWAWNGRTLLFANAIERSGRALIELHALHDGVLRSLGHFQGIVPSIGATATGFELVYYTSAPWAEHIVTISPDGEFGVDRTNDRVNSTQQWQWEDGVRSTVTRTDQRDCFVGNNGRRNCSSDMEVRPRFQLLPNGDSREFFCTTRLTNGSIVSGLYTVDVGCMEDYSAIITSGWRQQHPRITISTRVRSVSFQPDSNVNLAGVWLLSVGDGVHLFDDRGFHVMVTRHNFSLNNKRYSSIFVWAGRIERSRAIIGFLGMCFAHGMLLLHLVLRRKNALVSRSSRLVYWSGVSGIFILTLSIVLLTGAID